MIGTYRVSRAGRIRHVFPEVRGHDRNVVVHLLQGLHLVVALVRPVTANPQADPWQIHIGWVEQPLEGGPVPIINLAPGDDCREANFLSFDTPLPVRVREQIQDSVVGTVRPFAERLNELERLGQMHSFTEFPVPAFGDLLAA